MSAAIAVSLQSVMTSVKIIAIVARDRCRLSTWLPAWSLTLYMIADGTGDVGHVLEAPVAALPTPYEENSASVPAKSRSPARGSRHIPSTTWTACT